MYIHCQCSPRILIQWALETVKEDRPGKRGQGVEEVLWPTSRIGSSLNFYETMSVIHTVCTQWDCVCVSGHKLVNSTV